MSAHATRTQRHDDPGQPAADEQQHRQALRDLIDTGTHFARLLREKADAQAAQDAAPAPPAADAPPAPAPGTLTADPLVSLAGAFDRIARAVRRCILLARSLDQPAAPAQDPSQHRAAARKRILREVEDTIQRPSGNLERDGAEALHAELRERMDAPDLEDDIAGRPAADIIAEICRDLGLDAHPGTRPWKRRTPADIQQLCARAGAPSGPRQPGAGPQGPGRAAAQPTSDPQPDKPAAIARTQPGPARASPPGCGSGLPDDPAAAIATILRHPARAAPRWRPPPEA